MHPDEQVGDIHDAIARVDRFEAAMAKVAAVIRPPQDYVPRNRRPERKEAIAALIRYLDASPDLRIGQAVIGLFADKHEAFNAEDADLIAAVAARRTTR
jgi:hypothetical protein